MFSFNDARHSVPDRWLIVDGQFGIELHTPEAGYAWLGMTKALASVPGLPPLGREVAILVTATHTKAAYEFYAHAKLSGLSPAYLNQISEGHYPESFDAACKTAFKVATELCKPGPLGEKIWKEAVNTLGVPGATALIHYVGFINMLLPF
jgi:hypothetical protein